MGNSIQVLSENVSLIASTNTWIEGLSIEQLLTTMKLPSMVKAVGMPDLHPGQGYPIGAAYFSTELFYPALIGGDIGCGMGLWQTNIAVNKLSVDKLERRIGDIDEPVKKNKYQLGTIGGGNHFAELQMVTEVYDKSIFDQYQLDAKALFLLVHTGSRGLGHAILQNHVKKFNHHGLAQESESARIYLARHDKAVSFAYANRRAVAERMLSNLRAEGREILNVHHNYLEKVTIEGQEGWLHRKGASPSTEGLVMVPGSRGDYSYLVKPIVNEALLCSLAHGAGRKWKRADCKAKLEKRYSAQEMLRVKLGGRVICNNRSLLYEEAPQAYKSVDTVIESMQQAGVIEVIAQLKPILTYKTMRKG